MTIYRNNGRYDSSNVWFEDGQIKRYDKREQLPQMHHVDFGLGLFRAAAFIGLRDLPVDLSDVQTALVTRSELVGYQMSERFYEIGSNEGLNELDALLRAATPAHP